MNSLSLNNLWSYLQSLSLTANNQRWLAERLIEASNRHTVANDSEKLERLNALFGAWAGDDGENIEKAIREGRTADYEREIVSLDV